MPEKAGAVRSIEALERATQAESEIAKQQDTALAIGTAPRSSSGRERCVDPSQTRIAVDGA